jgi:antitoxin component of MazEF toxin-antitoxin module
MEKKTLELGVRTVSKRGGSFQVTIPSDVVRLMKMANGDRIAFSYDRELQKVIVGKVSRLDLEKAVSLQFSISKELAKKLLEGQKRA